MFISTKIRFTTLTARQMIEGIVFFGIALHALAVMAYADGVWQIALLYEIALHLIVGSFLVMIYRRVGTSL